MASTLPKRLWRDSRSDAALVYRRWYFTAAWRRLRAACLAREPNCRECRRAGMVRPATTADHVIPHKGNEALFFDLDNLQSLCDIHHGDKARIENGGRPKSIVGEDGWPLDR